MFIFVLSYISRLATIPTGYFVRHIPHSYLLKSRNINTVINDLVPLPVNKPPQLSEGRYASLYLSMWDYRAWRELFQL